ncbi:MAG: phytoene dehydrogenase, partial [Planctomycetes bacterium]|nr:phytoene dehydrogenase [Planctomycetota bacterium]
GLVDRRSGVVCCPSNYDGHEGMVESLFRVTWMANHGLWTSLDEDAYAAAKRDCKVSFLEQAETYAPGLGEHVVATDMFTPRTIERFTGHINGAVYGSPQQHRDGRTHLKNLFLCGTDQGYVGIIGAMLSGIMMANNHVLMDA